MKVEREDAYQTAMAWLRLELAKSRLENAQLQVQNQNSAWNQIQVSLASKYGPGVGVVTAVDPDQGTIDFSPLQGTPPYKEEPEAPLQGTPPYMEEAPEALD